MTATSLRKLAFAMASLLISLVIVKIWRQYPLLTTELILGLAMIYTPYM
jgi:hypothetical protein